MQLTKSELSTKLADIHELFGKALHVVFILEKTGEVTWSEMPDNIELLEIRLNFLSQELRVNFKPALLTVKLETIFRECYDQEDTCCGCRWFNKEAHNCVFNGRSLDDWPEIIEHCGYELEDKLW